MDLQFYRPASVTNDDRHGTVQRFEVGQPVRDGNGATVTRIQALPEGVLVTFETPSRRYRKLYRPEGVLTTSDEEKAPQEAQQQQQQQKGKRR